MYGCLEGKPFQLKLGLNLCKGVNVTGYTVFSWYATLTQE